MKLLEKKILLGSNLNNLRRFITDYNLHHEAIVNYDLLTPTMLVQERIDNYNNTNNKCIRLISNKESAFIIYDLIKENKYGLDKLSLSVDSVLKLLELINDCRLNEVDSYNGIYEADYNLLVRDYESKLNELGLVDYIYALKSLFNEKSELSIYVLNDLELGELEKRIINNFFKEVMPISPTEQEVSICGVYDTYGVYNELLNVIDIISTNKLALNDCEVVYTNDIYENLARGLFDSLEIKYRFSNVHARSTNLVSLILDIIDYINSDYKYELLEKVLKNQSLDQVYLDEYYKTFYFPDVIVGFGKDRTKVLLEDIWKKEEKAREHKCETGEQIYDGSKTKIHLYQFLTELLDAFESGFDFEKFITFIKKYCLAKNEKIALIDKIDNLKYLLNYTDDKLQLLADELSSMRYIEPDSTDGLLISKISKSFSLRPNLFIIGLNQTYLDSYDSESPFIIDVNKYKGLFNNNNNIHILECLKRNVTDALDYYKKYSSSNIYLSYNSYNKIDMRDSAKSVYLINLTDIKPTHKNLYDVYQNDIVIRKRDLPKSTITNHEYDNGSIASEIDHLDTDLLEDSLIVEKKDDDRLKLSPTSATNLISCPLSYYYKEIAKIQDVKHQNLDVHNWLEANEMGTFFHKILEVYAKKALTKDNFKGFVEEDKFDYAFKEALKETENKNATRNDYIKSKDIEKVKDNAHKYIEIVTEEFNDSPYRVLAVELNLTKYNVTYPKNDRLLFSGMIDRLDGYIKDRVLHLRFVDYKTGKYKAKEDNTYIQHFLYPYVIANYKGKLFDLDYDEVKIDSFIYAYPFENKSNCYYASEIIGGEKYDEVFANIDSYIVPYLNNEVGLFEKMYNQAEKNYLECEEKDDLCKYCTYKDICKLRLIYGSNK